jgi:SPP1 gp7 family putative phage head morphogenesis protein
VATDPFSPLPFAEAVAWAKARGVVLPDVYYGELQGLAQAMAFSIAGVASLDALTLTLDSLTKAMENGDSLDDWKKKVASGEIPISGLPPHRVENIFRTNIQSAYARGRCEQQRANYATRPWLMYDAVNDSRTRPAHAAMDGFVARYDDPVWSTWRPPCGYQCRCRVIALSDKQADKYRKADDNRMQEPGMHEARAQAITGGPDKGWDYDVCSDPTAGVDAAAKGREGNPLGVIPPAPVPEVINKDIGIPQHILDDIIKTGYNTEDNGRGDINLATVLKARGFDKLPTLLDKEAFDAFDSPLGVMYRGVNGKDFVDQFKTGDLFPGLGILGNGTYAAVGNMAEAEAMVYGSDLIRMKLKPDAKILDLSKSPKAASDFLKEVNNKIKKSKDSFGADDRSTLQQFAEDPGRAATMMGYDIILTSKTGGDAAYVVLLNRDAVVVLE